LIKAHPWVNAWAQTNYPFEKKQLVLCRLHIILLPLSLSLCLAFEVEPPSTCCCCSHAHFAVAHAPARTLNAVFVDSGVCGK